MQQQVSLGANMSCVCQKPAAHTTTTTVRLSHKLTGSRRGKPRLVEVGVQHGKHAPPELLLHGRPPEPMP